MRRWLSGLYDLTPYPGLVARRQAEAAYLILTVLIGLFSFGTIAPLIIRQLGVELGWTLGISRFVGVLIGLVIAFVTLRQGHIMLTRFILFGGGNVLLVSVMLAFGWNFATVMLLPVVLMAIAALISEIRGIIFNLVTALGVIIFVTIYQGMLFEAPLAAAGFLLIIVALLQAMLARGWQQSQTYFRDQAATQRLRMVEVSAEITQRIFQRTEPDILMTETVNLVRDRFDDIYHAQIFIIDDISQDAVLQASTGEAGRELLGRGHRLDVGSQSVIGQVTLRGEPVLARDTSGDPVHRRNELLPNTRTELALPLIASDQIIGALDVQSLQANAFTEEDIGTLQTLANQIAIAIDNARLFTEQQTIGMDNERLARQAREQLTQIQELNRRLTRHAWGEYMDRQELIPALTIDFDTESMTPNAEWTPALTEAVNDSRLVIQEDDQPTMAVPLNIRGQVIGAMEFELEPGLEIDPEQAALVEDVANRLALSLESARLYDEAQRLARREAIINDIGVQLQSASGVEGALVTAAQGVQSALDATRVTIRLGTPPSMQDTPAGEEADA
jgi:GAF domain-containing protein